MAWLFDRHHWYPMANGLVVLSFLYYNGRYNVARFIFLNAFSSLVDFFGGAFRYRAFRTLGFRVQF